MKTQQWTWGSVFIVALVSVLMLTACESSDNKEYKVIGSLVVSSQVEGVRYDVPSGSRYRFTIDGGAYSLGPTNGWATALYMYRDRPVETETTPIGRLHPTDEDASIGDFEEQASEAFAEQIGMGMQTNIYIQDYVIFIVPDDLGFFIDNEGSISLVVEEWD